MSGRNVISVVSGLAVAALDEQVEQGLKIDIRLGIDRSRFVAARHLDQAQVRPIGILAHELGVHGDEGVLGETLDEFGEVAGLGDQRVDFHK